MATLTVSIPDIEQAELIEALAKAYNYESKIRKREEAAVQLVDNPETAEAFVARTLAARVKEDFIRGGSTIAAQKATAEFRKKHKLAE